jgi:hypothetical protein
MRRAVCSSRRPQRQAEIQREVDIAILLAAGALTVWFVFAIGQDAIADLRWNEPRSVAVRSVHALLVLSLLWLLLLPLVCFRSTPSPAAIPLVLVAVSANSSAIVLFYMIVAGACTRPILACPGAQLIGCLAVCGLLAAGLACRQFATPLSWRHRLAVGTVFANLLVAALFIALLGLAGSRA